MYETREENDGVNKDGEKGMKIGKTCWEKASGTCEGKTLYKQGWRSTLTTTHSQRETNVVYCKPLAESY